MWGGWFEFGENQWGGLWKVNVLLFADDTVLLGESNESLQRLVTVFNRICMKSKLSLNGEKSKVMRVGENGIQRDMRIRMRRVVLDQVDRFMYLEVELNTLGEMKMETDHRLNVGNSALGGSMEVWKRGNMLWG